MPGRYALLCPHPVCAIAFPSVRGTLHWEGGFFPGPHWKLWSSWATLWAAYSIQVFSAPACSLPPSCTSISFNGLPLPKALGREHHSAPLPNWIWDSQCLLILCPCPLSPLGSSGLDLFGIRRMHFLFSLSLWNAWREAKATYLSSRAVQAGDSFMKSRKRLHSPT